MKRRVFILDSAYPEFLSSLPPLTGSYDEEFAKYMAIGFGTADFYSHALNALGWETVDVIANFEPLQKLWVKEHYQRWISEDAKSIALDQIRNAMPDVVFLQDLSFFDAATLQMLGSRYLLAGQCSCNPPSGGQISKLHVLFSSFPHFVTRFKAEYLPLAFDPRMLPPERERDLDISFVGGVGRDSHWRAGTDMLEIVAGRFKERFHWFGYGLDSPPASSALRACYCGPAWGRAMYEVYSRSKIVVNRHGEVAQGFANNLRIFEATGCGALLMTEKASNLYDLFPDVSVVGYTGVASLLEKIEYYLEQDGLRSNLASMAQRWTLEHHTYAQRMEKVSAVLSEALGYRQVAARSW